MENQAKLYDEWYFERKKYGKKKRAIQQHYLNMLSWADSVKVGVLDGRGKRALDVGCAYGFVVELLSRLGYDAVGVDVSSYAVEGGMRDGLLEADAEHLPFRNASFDLVTCFATLEHLPEPEKALREIYRVLKPNGVLVATTPNVNIMAMTVVHVLAREPIRTHPSVKPPNEWVREFLRAGFEKVKLKPFTLLPVPPTLLQKYFIIDAPLLLASHVKMVATKSC